jgi:predicted oxidoreductase (fatty acid repression mutant protein)
MCRLNVAVLWGLMVSISCQTFTTIATTGSASSGTHKYQSSVAVGSIIYFTPSKMNNVGKLDTATDAFTTIATTGEAASGQKKYASSVVVGSIIYFTPYTQSNVGKLDTATDAFTTIATTGDAASGAHKYQSWCALGCAGERAREAS